MKVDENYRRLFEEIANIRANPPEISLSSPLDVPCIIARNWLRHTYYGQFLSKIWVILVSVCRLIADVLPIVRIYLWGPDCLGEWEAIHESGFFIHFIRNWPNGNGETLSNGDVSVNARRLRQLLKYPEVKEVRKICLLASKLSLEQLVRLSYDVALDRKEPTGSVKIAPEEAFADVVKNTLCSAFLKGLPLKLFQQSLMVFPQGNVQINHIENRLEGYSEPYMGCLKIGPSNNLLTYHAICFLNVIGFKATIRSLSLLLSSHLLRATIDIKRHAREYFGTLSEFRQCKRYYEQARYDELTREQLCALEKLHRIETIAIKNTARSVDSLIQQGAIKRIGRELIAYGNVIYTPKGTTQFDPKAFQECYLTKMRQVHELHMITLQLRARQHSLSQLDQSGIEAERMVLEQFTESKTHNEILQQNAKAISVDPIGLLLLKIDRLQTFIEDFRVEDNKSHDAILRQGEEIKNLCTRYAEICPQKIAEIVESEAQELERLLLEIVEIARDRDPEVSRKAQDWYQKFVSGLDITANIVQLISFIAGIPSLPFALDSQTAERVTEFIKRVVGRLKW